MGHWPAQAGQFSSDDWSALATADVVIIGEIHDNPHHHGNQALAVTELEPGAIVFEQLTPDLATRVTPELRGDVGALGSVLEWSERGWPDFAMYHPIFVAAPDAAIFGGGLPRDEVRRAVTEGAAQVFGDASRLFGLGRVYPDAVQAELEAMQQTAHCDALPADMMSGMVEAQRLRDAALARAVLAAREESLARTDAGRVVVITGNGHAANRHAVPEMLRGLGLGLRIASVGQFEETAPAVPDFDHWLVTPGVDRADPCAAFR